MTKEEKSLGGTLGEGEASKKVNGQPIEVGQENVQPTNSDANSVSTDPKAIAEGFMEKLNEQVQSGFAIEQMDKKICRIIRSWGEKPSKEADNFFKIGYTKYRYTGRKLGQAAVPYKTGLDYLKSKYPKEDPKHLEEEYTWGYGEIDFDPDFRNYFAKNTKS